MVYSIRFPRMQLLVNAWHPFVFPDLDFRAIANIPPSAFKNNIFRSHNTLPCKGGPFAKLCIQKCIICKVLGLEDWVEQRVLVLHEVLALFCQES